MTRFMSSQTRRIQRILEPLSKAEERRARKVATEHFLNKAGQNVRYRLIDVGLRIEKPEGAKQAPLRIIQVVFANYTDRRSVVVLINDKGQVAGDDVLEYQPSLSDEERTEARDIAQRDERIAPIAKRRNVFVSEVSPLNHDVGDLERGARVIGLRYVLLQKGRYTHLATAVVSITDQSVVSFQPIEGE